MLITLVKDCTQIPPLKDTEVSCKHEIYKYEMYKEKFSELWYSMISWMNYSIMFLIYTQKSIEIIVIYNNKFT